MIGLFIGSFNPPTLAHLKICLKLKKRFSKIIFIPVNTKNKDLVSLNHRINMLNLYKMQYPFLDIDSIMNDYSYFDYRILDLLKKKYGNVKIIIGSDILDNLDKYDNKDYILDNYNFIVIERNMNVEKVITEKYQEYFHHFEIVKYHMDISSTKARELIKNNKSTKNILDKEIKNYIINNYLYF